MFSEPVKKFLDRVFDKYIRYSAWALVDATHKSGSPWHKTYANGTGDRHIIPQSLIIKAKLLN